MSYRRSFQKRQTQVVQSKRATKRVLMHSMEFRYLAVFFGLLLINPSVPSQAHSSGPAERSLASYFLKTSWSASGSFQELKSWNLNELGKLKKITSRERDPASGRLVRWEGVLLSQVVEKILEGLPLESRAQVDLVILKGKNGESALIPRALVSKYPVMLALNSELGDLANSTQYPRGPVSSVIPWSSKPKILNEDLPLESYFVPTVAQVELSNYRDRYSPLYLKRRTDPSAVRGEKLFVQNCVSCHAAGSGPGMSKTLEEDQTKRFALNGHPPIRTSLKLSEKDRRSIMRYLEAHRTENPVSLSQRIHSVQAGGLSGETQVTQ